MSAAGGNTLGGSDALVGGAGADSLTVDLAASATPLSIAGIETINVTGAAATLNLNNATDVTAINVQGNSGTTQVTNIGTLANLGVSDTAASATFAFKTAAVSATGDSVALALKDVSAGTVTVTGAITNLNVTANGTANVLTGLASTSTKLSVAGAGDVDFGASGAGTVGRSATTVDASAATGKVTFISELQTAAANVTGGAGNDTLTFTGASAVNDTINAGAGDDTVTFTANLADTDVAEGGSGTDTVVSTKALLTGLTTANKLTGFEVIQVSDSLTSATLTVATVAAGSSVTLAAGASAGVVTFEAGSKTLNLGTANGGALTVNDTGLATNDSLTVNAKAATDSFGAASTAGRDLAVNGFESVTLYTGTTVGQNVNDIDVVGDPASSGVQTAATLVLTGAGGLTMVNDSTNSDTAVITLGASGAAGKIDASALTGAFVMVNASVGVTSIAGGAGNDTLLANDSKNTISGGAGTDQITGGTGNDVITGDAGKDTITGSAGNDNISGGDDADRFIFSDANLTATTTIDGGSGTDTLYISDFNSIADAQLTGVTSVETLTSAATGLVAILGAKAAAAGISTVTLVGTNGTGMTESITVGSEFTNAALTVNLDSIDGGGGTDDLNHVIATDYTGSLTIVGGVSAFLDDGGSSIIGGSGTDTLRLSGGSYGDDLKNVSAVENITITDDVSTSITLVDGNTTATGTLTIDGRSIVSAANTLTVDASAEASGKTVIYGSTGKDTVTGGTGSDTIVGGAGADSINGSAGGNDSLSGGEGNDTFYMGTAWTTADVIDGGTGTDTLTVDGATLTSTTLGTVTDVETLQVSGASTVTLTAATTFSTIVLDESGDQVLTLGTGYTGDTAVTIQNDATSNADKIVNTAAVALTVTAVDTNIDSTTTITGGSGVDTLNITTSNTTAVGVNIAAVTKVETINFTAGSAGSGYDGSIDLGTYTTALTINGNTLVTGEDLTVIGGSATGAITVNGTAGVNNILTGSGADVITAGAGADTINSGSGNDYIDGGSGIDTLEGMSGNDTILGGDGADSIVGGAGIDSLVGGSGNDVFYVGSTASDFVTLTTAEVVIGGAGTDKLTIAADTDINNTDLVGLSSIEEIEFTAAATTSIILADNVFTANGLTTLSVTDTDGAYANTVSAGTLSSANSVTITLNDTYANVDQSITLGAGNDLVYITVSSTTTGFEGTDAIAAGSGTDTLRLTTSTNASVVDLTAVSGFESINTYGTTSTQKGYSIVVTGITNDLVATGGSATFDFSDRTGVVTLMGGSESDILIITTGTAADTIVSGSGADIISSGSGNDTVTSGAGADSILGGAGADSITADAGNDTVSGEAGDDIIVAGAGNDLIDGGSGDDNITGGSGLDNITAGTGSDTIVFTEVSDSSGTSFDTITDWVSADDTLQIALSYSAAITNQTINAVLLTAAANDSINPSLSGYKGEAIYDTTNSKLYVNYTDGSSTGITSLDYTIAINAASTAANTVVDGDINFVITGGAANDSITAGGGLDTIGGGSGNDTIDGGAGNDSITGGVGVDSLIGGSGNDVFVIAAITDMGSGEVISGGTGTDTISFGAAGAITFASATVTGVEVLAFTAGGTNAVTLVEGMGVTSITGLNTAAATTEVAFTLSNGSYTVFAADAGSGTGSVASAALVTSAGKWFAAKGTSDVVLTYWDQGASAAVAITLVGVEASLTTAFSISSGDILMAIS